MSWMDMCKSTVRAKHSYYLKCGAQHGKSRAGKNYRFLRKKIFSFLARNKNLWVVTCKPDDRQMFRLITVTNFQNTDPTCFENLCLKLSFVIFIGFVYLF